MINRFFAGVLLAVTLCSAADPRSADLQIRLTTPLSSRVATGTPFRARVIGAVLPTEAVLPTGTIVHGVVRDAQSVGLGFRRERALLKLDFLGCELPGQDVEPCSLALLRVDNARETVQPGNVVKGVIAASYPNSWFNGVWYRPTAGFARRAAVGLTGTAGTVQSRMIPNPVGASVILASKLLVLRMPEPEIVFPAGTEMIVRVGGTVQSGNEAVAERAPAVSNRADLRFARTPVRVMRPDGKAAYDIIHLAFFGSEEAVVAAFGAAGWHPAEPRSANALARSYSAFTTMNSYPTAPVSPLYYEGRLPDLVFQKSLNSISKRHHIRIWRDNTAAEPVYLAASTHDIGIGFRWTRMQFGHDIHPQIDLERTKVLNDLADAGCISSMEKVERPSLAQASKNTDAAETDGRLYVVELRTCSPKDPETPLVHTLRRGLWARSTRRMVLETRQYLTRGNIIYVGINALRPRSRKKDVETE